MSDTHVPDVRRYSFKHRRRTYHVTYVETPFHKVEITTSPSGRSVQVFFDGQKMSMGDHKQGYNPH